MNKKCDICHKNWEDDGHYSSVSITFNNENPKRCETISPTLCPICLYNMIVAVNLVKDYPDFENRLHAFMNYKPDDLKEP